MEGLKEYNSRPDFYSKVDTLLFLQEKMPGIYKQVVDALKYKLLGVSSAILSERGFVSWENEDIVDILAYFGEDLFFYIE